MALRASVLLAHRRSRQVPLEPPASPPQALLVLVLVLERDLALEPDLALGLDPVLAWPLRVQSALRALVPPASVRRLLGLALPSWLLPSWREPSSPARLQVRRDMHPATCVQPGLQ